MRLTIYEEEIARFFKEKVGWILVIGNPTLRNAIGGYSLKKFEGSKEYVYTELSCSDLIKIKKNILLNEYIKEWSFVIDDNICSL